MASTAFFFSFFFFLTYFKNRTENMMRVKLVFASLLAGRGMHAHTYSLYPSLLF